MLLLAYPKYATEGECKMKYNTDLEKLRVEMFRKKVSQEKLARVLAIAKASVCRKLNGKTEFTVTESQQICTYLGINPADIFFIPLVPNSQQIEITER